MNSRSGDRVPAGVSGQAGRGTVGTVAPTGRFGPIVWVAAVGYIAAAVFLIVLAVVLAPWGLLLLLPAIGLIGAAMVLVLMAVGIDVVEADES